MSDKPKYPVAITMTPCESSQLAEIGHCADTNTLAIRFKNKGGPSPTVYHYPNFSAEQFKEFSEAESLGKHFGAHIKSLPFVKIEPDPAE